MKKLISIDLCAEFGMLKKPDTNEPVYLTFNMLHKPALLGILGAIAGLKGFEKKGVLPEYYTKLKNLKVGIQPLNHENGNYQKTTITYNNTTGMASKETGGNLIVNEQTLVAPAFRCYFLLDNENELHQQIDQNLASYHAEYLPYLGKNEFSVWWKDYKEYDDVEDFEAVESFKICSIFIKDQPIKDGKDIQPFNPVFTPEGNTFSYFERLPVAYNEKLFQYEYRNFAFTDWSLKIDHLNAYKPEHTDNRTKLLKIDSNELIQVF
ncbi:MAG: type I-B CRISPR-associated protein Cas5b [Bacteroidales bacterium]|jgi:CRISPR-associated protein Cas5h|nr:type I-B CRISPR-associated protein Cas5b [Bacteroidales bacterium]